MYLSQRQTDVAVMFLAAAGGAVVGVAADAWWWILVGFAALALAGYLLNLRYRQNDATAHRAAQVGDIYREISIRSIVSEEIDAALERRMPAPDGPPADVVAADEKRARTDGDA